MEKKKRAARHVLVLATAAFALLLFISVGLHRRSLPAKNIFTQTERLPIVGKSGAKIGLLLIEDFRCPACLVFMEKIFPSLQNAYIDTGIAFCIFVPVALFEGSEELANAALTLYRIAPLQFLSYVRALYENIGKRDEWTKEDLLALAERIGGIDLDRLQTCIEMDCFAAQVKQNLEWAKKIMGEGFEVPALYINGIPVSISSFDVISKRIEDLYHL